MGPRRAEGGRDGRAGDGADRESVRVRDADAPVDGEGPADLARAVREALRPDGGPAEERLARHAADLRRRLRPSCREWSEAEFERLVQRIARTQARWDETEH